MKIVKVLFLCFLSLSFTHKFYLSVTNIEYNEAEKSVQIISRIFIDDFQLLLKERYDYNEELASEKETKQANELIAKYFSEKLTITINGEQKQLEFLGKEYEDDMMVSYIEIPNVTAIESIVVQNKMLFDVLEEQQNIIHAKINNQRESVMLIKENDKALLKF